MKVYSYDPAKKKQILCGEIIEHTFFREVSTSHFMRVLNGYGIQEDAYQKLREHGVKKITLIELKTTNSWVSDIVDWEMSGKVADYGHGKQRFLSLKYMHSKKNIKVNALGKPTYEDCIICHNKSYDNSVCKCLSCGYTNI